MITGRTVRNTIINADTCARPAGQRPAQRRAGALAAVAAGAALLAAACGGSSTGSPPAAGPAAYQQALAYAQCMRIHGTPGFPDPGNQGLFRNLGPVNIHSPLYLSANKACGHLLPSYRVTPAQMKQDLSRALKAAACMRSHGILSYPDPVELANGNIELGPGAAHDSSPQFQAAARSCLQFLPGGP
jgi:hypothetical protein